MTSEENYLDQLLADANDKLNQMENANDDSEAESEIDENVDDFVSKGEEELEEFMKQFDESSENAEDSSNSNSSDGEDLVPDDSDDSIPQEEILDMDDIDSLLADISEIHPERNKSAEELNERIAKYEENPEEAENALMADDDETDADDEVDAKAASGVIDDDFLSSLEDVDALLQSVEEQAKKEDEEIQKQLQDESDPDIADINDILSKSDNNEAVNDDLLSMIEGIENEDDGNDDSPKAEKDSEGEAEAEDTKKDKKKDKKNKKNKKNKEAEEKSEGASDENETKAHSKGLFAKLKAFIFDSDEDEEDEEEKSADSPKKGKGKKNEKAKADDNAAIEAELEAEDKKGKKKKKDKKDKKEKPEKKVKAPKNPKKAKEEEIPEKPGIKTRGIVLAMAFCLTLLALILFFAIGGSRVINRNKARVAYYKGDYTTASNLLYKMKLNNSDELIFKKASVLSKLDLYCQKAEAYKTYPNRKAWLDALLEARQKCDEVYLDAKELGITEEVDLYARNIEKELNDEFGITPEVVEEICNMKPLYYTYAVENIIDGKPYNEIPELTGTDTVDSDSKENSGGEENTVILEDMLPEEEAIINGMEKQ